MSKIFYYIKNLIWLASFITFIWILISFINVNMHNGINDNVNNIFDWNFFIIFSDILEKFLG